ncbi:SAM-dependent chlorinase/fluorinase [Candidatus Roizmanbacteria bacterium]|nr:SAM-dependent chlorinase/fluorinase [Candidatus Roizmanbacteria bacterium]
MKKLIIVSDWASDSLTREEVRLTVLGFLKDPSSLASISFVSATVSTIHTSFLTAQVVEREQEFGRPQESVIFQNTDPRFESPQGSHNSQGAEFLIAKLHSGIFVCGPNAGNNFSFVKEKIQVLFLYKKSDEKTQFRSRDLYARICAHLMDGLEDELDLEEVSVDKIPDIDGYYIGHIDNYGNIKTTLTPEDFKGKYEFGEMVRIRINRVEKQAKFVTGLFGGTLGELVIYPGSSGPRDNPYLEISIWRHFTEENPTTGKHEFNNPRPGTKVEIL